MKKTLFLLSGLFLGFTTSAQVKTPALSPRAEVEQEVGLTEIELDYSRPSLRGRDMHKEIIPEGLPWRFGANKNSTISFDTPVNFGGTDIKAGEYAIFATPGKKSWKISLYTETENWGLPKEWNTDKVAAEISVPVKKIKNKVETFTLAFENLNVSHFDLTIAWEHSFMSIKIKLPTDELTKKSIEETMKGKPSERDYYNAANYYLHANSNLDDALLYVDKAIEMNENAPFYYIRKRALILHAKGDNAKAIQAAKQSLEMAKKAGSEEYIRKNEKSIKEWSK